MTGAAWLADVEGDFGVEGLIDPAPGLLLTGLDLRVDDRAVLMMPDIEVSLRWPVDLAVGGFAVESSTTQDAEGRPLAYPRTPDLRTPVAVQYGLIDLYVEGRWRVVDTDRWRVGLGLAVHWLEATLETEGIAIPLELDSSIIFPLVAADMQWRASDWLHIGAHLQAIDVDLGDKDIRFVDARLQARVTPLRRWSWLAVDAGLRYTVARTNFENVEIGLIPARSNIDLDILGPFVGLMARF
jgi:hypothetical protein